MGMANDSRFEKATGSHYEIGSTQMARIAHFLLERISKPTHTSNKTKCFVPRVFPY
jgi:hypothetical protein